MPLLTDQQVYRYFSDGWVAPIEVLSKTEAAEILSALEDAEAEFPEDLHAGQRNNAHLALPFLADLALHERILDSVASVVDRPVALLNSVLFVKEPDSPGYVSWHQDATYMGVDSTNMVTAWIALTPSTSENGCVAMVPSSHLNGIYPHIDRYGPDNILTRGQHVDGVDVDDAVDVELCPGQMSLHHPHLVHGSRPNRTNSRRVGVAFQSYVGAEVRPTRGDHHVIAVTDQAVDPSFTLVPRPDAEMTDDGRRIRAAANDALADVLYHGASRRREY